VNKPRANQEGMRKNMYILQVLVNNGENQEWVNVMTETRLNDGVNRIRKEQRFFATELQKVDKDSKKLISVDVMNRLNKEATNLYDADRGYSGNTYDLAAATRNGVIYPSLDPSIFEVKFLNQDLKGRVVNY
jgi:hypothetical protein